MFNDAVNLTTDKSYLKSRRFFDADFQPFDNPRKSFVPKVVGDSRGRDIRETGESLGN